MPPHWLQAAVQSGLIKGDPMYKKKHSTVHVGAPILAATLLVIASAGCSDRRPVTTTPSVTPVPTAPASTSSSSSSGPVIPPSTGTDVVTKKGTETGMVGGESGTVAASGKPGTGTASGAGTGAAIASDEKTTNKK